MHCQQQTRIWYILVDAIETRFPEALLPAYWNPSNEDIVNTILTAHVDLIGFGLISVKEAIGSVANEINQKHIFGELV